MNLTQKVKPSYWDDVEDQLQGIFYEIIFRPIVNIIKSTTAQLAPSRARHFMNEFLNADPGRDQEILRNAMRTGRIQYSDGMFFGQFSAGIGRALRAIGASFDPHMKVYRLKASMVPGWVSAEAGVYKSIARTAHTEIKKTVDQIRTDLDRLVEKYQVHPNKTIGLFEKDFEPIAKAIEVHPNLGAEARAKLAEEYSKNMKLWIKKFSEEQIMDIRGVVEKNADEGYRFDRLIDGIQSRYNVSRSKAQFLARQETALFMSKFRKNRFQEGGITHYRWSTAHDARVRPQAGVTGRARLNDHRHLDGRVFSYNDPPIVDMATGRKAGPGEDFNCRCVDIPILRSITEAT